MIERNLDSEAAIISNDLDSIAIRIELLQAHVEYTNAGEFVRQAKAAINKGRSDIHHATMRDRFAKMDRAS